MTAPTLDLGALPVEDVPDGVPNHRASSGERGEKPRMAQPTGRQRIFGRTGGASSNRAENVKPKRESPPKLSAGMKGQLEDLYSGIGAMIMPFDPVMGQTIIDNARQCAKSVYDLAQQNDAVRRFVISLTTTSAVGALIMAHLPILLAVVRHSKNEGLRNGAEMGMVALKFASAADAASMFGNGQDSEDSKGE